MTATDQDCEADYRPLPRNTPPWRAGKRAYFEGFLIDDNPHEKGDKRRDWFVGWLDAKEAKFFER